MGEKQQPGSRWHLPSPDAVKYWKGLLELALLLIALPWILKHVLANPDRAVENAGYLG